MSEVLLLPLRLRPRPSWRPSTISSSDSEGSKRRFTVTMGDWSSKARFALNVIQMPSRCQMRPPAVKRLRRGRSSNMRTRARSSRWNSVIGRSDGRDSLRWATKASARSTERSWAK